MNKLYGSNAKIQKTYQSFVFIICFVLIAINQSCKKFVDVPISSSFIDGKNIFKNDATTKSLSGSMYNKLIDVLSFASGSSNAGITVLCGLTSDELKNEVPTNATIQPFYKNSLLPTLNAVNDIWNEAYKINYTANILIEGLPAASKVSPNLRTQLLGEAYFIRAFIHFYMVNLYGEIPIITTTNYEQNLAVQRQPVNKVYDQLIADLKNAESLLSQAETMGGYLYANNERISPNSFSAKFLLARAYLYKEDWANAENYASAVISGSAYSILTDLNQVFKPNNSESVWQLKPLASRMNTFEGGVFIITSTPGSGSGPVSLTTSITNEFETGDLRKVNWVGSFTNTVGTWNYAYKYKVKSGPLYSEYSVVFRLAEMYLVRAEARAKRNQLSSSIDDVDIIRARASLPLIRNTNPGITQTALLDAILHERKTELFTEWGHRWFDLKRTGKADQVLSPIKGTTWQSTDQLFPIPQAEVTNGNRTQNPGY